MMFGATTFSIKTVFITALKIKKIGTATRIILAIIAIISKTINM